MLNWPGRFKQNWLDMKLRVSYGIKMAQPQEMDKKRIYKDLMSFGKSGWIKWSEIESSKIVIHYLGDWSDVEMEKPPKKRWMEGSMPLPSCLDLLPAPIFMSWLPAGCIQDSTDHPGYDYSHHFSWELRNETPINLLPLVSPLKKNWPCQHV